MFVNYDPSGEYPQAPIIGGQFDKPNDRHVPIPGMASFAVANEILDALEDRRDIERYYEVTAPGVLTRKDDEAINAIVREKARHAKIAAASAEAKRRRDAVVPVSDVRDLLALTARAVAKVRREAQGRSNAGEVASLDQLEAMANAIDAIDSARDTIHAEIGASNDPSSYDVVGSQHWPI